LKNILTYKVVKKLRHFLTRNALKYIYGNLASKKFSGGETAKPRPEGRTRPGERLMRGGGRREGRRKVKGKGEGVWA